MLKICHDQLLSKFELYLHDHQIKSIKCCVYYVNEYVLILCDILLVNFIFSAVRHFKTCFIFT